MAKILSKNFYDREVLEVAPEMLGKFLVRRNGRRTEKFKITEAEAYDGEGDLACHASGGKTERNKVMFGKPGHFYVYLVYGMHYMLNVVTGPGDCPSAVLIRGVEGIEGPGRVTKALKIDKSFNGKAVSKKSGLWIEDGGEKIKKRDIEKTPRIGVDYAGEVWSKKPYRFVLKN